MSAALTGLTLSAETRQKIRVARLGATCSEGCSCKRHLARFDPQYLDGSPARTHGLRKSPEYRSWTSMKRRCYSPSAAHYDRYGGRGIRVCARWLASFENFYADMGERPEPKNLYSLNRLDNDGDYEPANCVWATAAEQAQNRSPPAFIRASARLVQLAHDLLRSAA